MNYLDLFAGIGGFHEGLKQSGFKFDWVGFSEIDKYAKQIYKKHFPEAEDLGDVRTIDTGRLPRINLITYGFPCQDISIAGKRAGLAGKRSGLFSEAIRIIRATKPDYFIFENVKGLFSSNQGRDFEYILRTIADSGYDGQWQLLNTRWVLPQNRERIYFVGHLREQSRPEIFPLGEGNSRCNERTEQTTINTLTAGGHSGGHHSSMTLIQVGVINKDAQGSRIYDPAGLDCSLVSCAGGHGGTTGLYEIRPCLTPDRKDKKQHGRRFKENGDPMFTLTGQDVHGVEISPCIRSEHHNTADVHFINQESKIRRLTPTEAERLQGFEDGWTEGISDSQRYKCLGNAVTVPIVKMVGEKLLMTKTNKTGEV